MLPERFQRITFHLQVGCNVAWTGQSFINTHEPFSA